MVLMGRGREREGEKAMALHNFDDTAWLKWGSQRVLRCMRVGGCDGISAVDRRSLGLIGGRRGEGGGVVLPVERRKSAAAVIDGGDGGIEAVRTKLMFDLQAAADKIKDAILREGLAAEGGEEEEQQPPPPAVEEELPQAVEEELPAPAETEVVRPWNLRTRRAACKAPKGGGGGGKGFSVDVGKPSSSPSRVERAESRSPRLRGSAAAGGNAAVPSSEKRAKFSVALSRREIEQDFLAMVGQRPPRRPKKRPRIVQKQMDTLFPGLWLTEVSAEDYKVPDEVEVALE
ncbi:hypothetical protein RJ640_026671 [Escallonia rubra]|uniref:DUF1639 family protein n=1 Tax=Escallonia rubra TaxID=112253 RepID=A0AA88QLE0_9ASTE|nr:hypothetical protein RJ640_026671 [Escallonia rubra]